MKKSIINLKHPETLYIKHPIFKVKKRKCLLLVQLNQELMSKILDCLRLAEIVNFYTCFRHSSKCVQLKQFVISYLIICERLYSKWEEKEFLDLLVSEHRYKGRPIRKREMEDSRVSTKSQLASSISMAQLDSIISQKSRVVRTRQAIVHDVERTNLKFQSMESSKKIESSKMSQSKGEWPQSRRNSKSYGEIERMQQYLNRVLTNISKRYPRLGYIQGFNYIAKNLFLTGFTEEEAYLYSCYMITEKKLGEIILNNMHGLKQLAYVLKVYIFNYVPEVYRHMERAEVEPEIFATSWFITLFSEDLIPQTVNKLWHLFVLEGWKIFIQFIIAVICIYQKEILAQSPDDIFSFLRRLLVFFRQDSKRNRQKESNVWKLMASVEVSGRMVDELCRQMENLHRDSQIQIWRLKYSVHRPHCNSDQVLRTPQPINKSQLSVNWCFDRPVGSSHSCGGGSMFPFCHNVGTLPSD